MQLLLDTHVLIWFINGDAALSSRLQTAIRNIENKCYVSIASIWEIAIKKSLGKLQLNIEFDAIKNLLAKNEIEILPLYFDQIQQLLTLPFHHRDPFDRIIIAQSMSEDLTVATKDDLFKNYDVKVYW